MKKIDDPNTTDLFALAHQIRALKARRKFFSTVTMCLLIMSATTLVVGYYFNVPQMLTLSLFTVGITTIMVSITLMLHNHYSMYIEYYVGIYTGEKSRRELNDKPTGDTFNNKDTTS